MKLGFTGTRRGMTLLQRDEFMDFISSLPKITEFHHGCCIGADYQAHEFISKYSKKIIIHGHPSNLKRNRAVCECHVMHPELPPLERNRIIVDSVDFMVAIPFTQHEELRSGTWATIRYTRRLGRKGLKVIYP